MKHDTLTRFAFIETRLLWGNGLTAGELGKAFGLARQNAQAVIKRYRQKNPGNMRYDRSGKRHVAAPGFEPTIIYKDVHRFLDYQRGSAMVGYYHDQEDWAELPFMDCDRLVRPALDRQAVATVLTALRNCQAVQVTYHAKHGVRVRELSPHQLVYADGRYHLRAYCRQTEHYSDYVLSRLYNASINKQGDWVSDEGDAEWHRRVTLHCRINPALPDETQESLARDYALENGRDLVLPGIREAVEKYPRRQLTRPDWLLGMPLWRVEIDRDIQGNAEY